MVFFYDFSLLYIYVRSSRIYGKWWRSKNWTESEKYGINQKEHQILLRMTRFTVVSVIVVMFDILSLLMAVIQVWQISHSATVWGLIAACYSNTF